MSSIWTSRQFALSTGGPPAVDIVRVHGGGLGALLVLGIPAVLGGVLHPRLLVIVAGAGFVLAAVIQLLQVGRSTNWLSGDGSTLALMGEVGIGLLTVGLAPRNPCFFVEWRSARSVTCREFPALPPS